MIKFAKTPQEANVPQSMDRGTLIADTRTELATLSATIQEALGIISNDSPIVEVGADDILLSMDFRSFNGVDQKGKIRRAIHAQAVMQKQIGTVLIQILKTQSRIIDMLENLNG